MHVGDVLVKKWHFRLKAYFEPDCSVILTVNFLSSHTDICYLDTKIYKLTLKNLNPFTDK